MPSSHRRAAAEEPLQVFSAEHGLVILPSSCTLLMKLGIMAWISFSAETGLRNHEDACPAVPLRRGKGGSIPAYWQRACRIQGCFLVLFIAANFLAFSCQHCRGPGTLPPLPCPGCVQPRSLVLCSAWESVLGGCSSTRCPGVYLCLPCAQQGTESSHVPDRAPSWLCLATHPPPLQCHLCAASSSRKLASAGGRPGWGGRSGCSPGLPAPLLCWAGSLAHRDTAAPCPVDPFGAVPQ